MDEIENNIDPVPPVSKPKKHGRIFTDEDRAKAKLGGKPTTFNRLRNLVTYKDLSDDELKALIQKKAEQHREFELNELFPDPKELNQAKSILDKYLEEYTIESASDRAILKDIVYLEMINFRMKMKLNESYKKDKSIPGNYQESLKDNMTAIIELKKNLGMIRGEDSEDDGFKEIQNMRKRFAQWQAENQASFALKCAHCQKMLNVIIKKEHYDVTKYPFFEDRYFINVPLIKLYIDKVIDKQTWAAIMGVSTDYADFILDLTKTNPKVRAMLETKPTVGDSSPAQTTVPVLEPQVPSELTEGQNHTAVEGDVPSTANFVNTKTEENI